MTTETKRDLHADLAICNAATEGPWYVTEDDERPVVSDHYAILLARGSDVAYVGLSSEDQEFIVEARTGWPIAIERAISAERRVAELCESNAYYIDQFERTDARRWELEEAVSQVGNELADTRDELERLRAGIMVAMTYSGGIIVEMLRKLLTEVGEDE